jgi:hypothetical protein
MKYQYKLISKGAGFYEANNIVALAWYVFSHRIWHLFKGDGWVD